MSEKIELTRDWWRRTEPFGLARTGKNFERAVVQFEKAERRLHRRPDSKRLWLYEKAIADIEKEAGDVRRLIRLLRTAPETGRDQAKLEDLHDLFGKPLDDRMKTALEIAKGIDAQMSRDADELFGNTDAHKAYFRRMVNRLKREPHNFGLALPTQEIEDMRFQFDKIKPPRTLGLMMRKGLGAQRYTYGLAGGERLAQDLGITDLAPRTLLLYLEGPLPPGLPMRMRRLLRTLSVGGFSRVRVIQKGAVTGGKENAEFVEAMKARGIDDATIKTLLEKRGSGSKGAAPPGVTVALRRRIWTALPAIKQAPGPRRRRLAVLARSAAEMLETRNFEIAEQMIVRLERDLARIAASNPAKPPPPKPAKAPPPGKLDAKTIKV